MVDKEAAACNSIANCNCSIYSYHSVARFGSALHQKHWHRKHLRWAPELRRVPKAPFSASIYNTPTYGCTSMLTFILNVLGEVLGIGNLYSRPFYSAGSGPCARPRDFENRLLSDVLANFGRFLPPLILEQTLTALLADGQRHSFETAPNRPSTSPRAFFDNDRARLRGLHSAAWNT